MKKLKFTGLHPHAVSLADAGDVVLCEGQVYELDETNNHVKTLVAKELLVEEPEKEKEVKPNKKEKI